MDPSILGLIKRIVDYKWHGEGDYDKLKREVESIKDKETRERLEEYLEEAREFSNKVALEKEVEQELLEEWLLEKKPIKMKYKSGKYVFDLKDEEGEE